MAISDLLRVRLVLAAQPHSAALAVGIPQTLNFVGMDTLMIGDTLSFQGSPQLTYRVVYRHHSIDPAGERPTLYVGIEPASNPIG